MHTKIPQSVFVVKHAGVILDYGHLVAKQPEDSRALPLCGYPTHKVRYAAAAIPGVKRSNLLKKLNLMLNAYEADFVKSHRIQ